MQIWLAPVVCTRRIYNTRSSRDASKRRVLATVHTKDEHFIILIFSERDHLIMLPSRSKQNKMHKRINITCSSYVIWYGPFVFAPLIFISKARTWSPSSTGMISIIVGVASRFMAPSSWLFTSCSNYYNYFEILLNMKFKDNHKAPAGCHNTIMIISYIFIITSWPYHITKPCKNKLDASNLVCIFYVV